MISKPLKKLGRPFKGGSKRDKYIKFYFTDDEIKSLEDKEKIIASFLQENGFSYNRPAFFRILFTVLDDKKLINTVFKSFDDSYDIFKICEKKGEK